MEVVAVRRSAVRVRSVVVAGTLVLGVAGGAHAWEGPEADVAYHGRVSLARGQLRVLLLPENDGPAAVPAATVRLRLSADLADRQDLAAGCARSGMREVVCETGALPEHGRGRHIGLLLELRERPAEVALRIDTWWNGGATDRNLGNNELAVLALDTGDSYAF
ncbi:MULTISPECIES: hypothetical protein [unclassified Streptomyces]|uniref:hypothetical protein n=1 Tax=unclassified Streptomyces TaxID=2593676 RepID=UPI001BE5396D|nr:MULTISPECIES: hypothetical protein [unclassified Streptomyces]MBT2406796.1 hypothetical protein [Streptomyces sp. ISL-21]MBT2456652.1 hypothetical protein [Streptomyces sp. ISL-86]MBT2612196.1 hypothetical protein [Streptomyces sp. ISL-87]